MKYKSGPRSMLTLAFGNGELFIHSSRTGEITSYPMDKMITDGVPKGRIIHNVKGMFVQRLLHSTMEDRSCFLTLFGTSKLVCFHAVFCVTLRCDRYNYVNLFPNQSVCTLHV